MVMLVQATLQRSAAGPADLGPTAAGYRRIAAILGALVGAVILMDPLGFRLTSLGFYLFLLTRSAGRLGVALVVAVAGSFGVYYVFATSSGSRSLSGSSGSSRRRGIGERQGWRASSP